MTLVTRFVYFEDFCGSIIWSSVSRMQNCLGWYWRGTNIGLSDDYVNYLFNYLVDILVHLIMYNVLGYYSRRVSSIFRMNVLH